MKTYLFDLLAVCALSASASAAQYVPINAELPPQTGQSGKVLGTDGSSTSWVVGSSNVPNPSATGQMMYSADGSTWIVLGIGTNGQCLLSNGSPLIPTWGSCGGSTSDLGTSGTYSAPLKIEGGYAGSGKSGFGFFTLGSSATDTCSGIVGEYVDLYVDIGGAYNGPAMTINSKGSVGFCGGSGNSGLHAQRLSSSETVVAASGFLLTTDGTYTDSTGGANATMSLGQIGAPSGTCASGSIYTQADGQSLSTNWICISGGWIANGMVATPWHPVSDPSCSVSTGGTSCTTTVTVPGPDTMRCSANDEADPLVAAGDRIGVSVPVSGVVTIKYTSLGVVAGGGTAGPFSVVCS